MNKLRLISTSNSTVFVGGAQNCFASGRKAQGTLASPLSSYCRYFGTTNHKKKLIALLVVYNFLLLYFFRAVALFGYADHKFYLKKVGFTTLLRGWGLGP